MADKRPWFFRDSVVIMAVLGLLVFALPLVWLSPYYSLRHKIVVTIIVAVGTYYTCVLTIDMYKSMKPYLDMIR